MSKKKLRKKSNRSVKAGKSFHKPATRITMADLIARINKLERRIEKLERDDMFVPAVPPEPNPHNPWWKPINPKDDRDNSGFKQPWTNPYPSGPFDPPPDQYPHGIWLVEYDKLPRF